MRLLVCGGREFTDVEYAIPRIHREHQKTPVTMLICGMARGGDMIGHAWAKALGIPIDEFPIRPEDWDRHGNAAGPIRNMHMRDKGKPDLVLGLPGETGTANMLEIADAAGIRTIEFKYRYFSGARDPVDGYLSNFYESEQIDDDGVVYPTNEHWYQAAKTLDPRHRASILASSTPGIAKRKGNSAILRPDWETYKFEAMMIGLRQKFRKGSGLAERLIATGDDYLVEYTRWNDRIWGVGTDKQGMNWLGRLLMRRRDELLV